MRCISILSVGMLVLITCAHASISIRMGCYNSNDEMGMSIDGTNVMFDAFCALEPESLEYSNGGSSTFSEADYSYSLSLNGRTLFSNAETDSGMFSWSGRIEAGGELGLDVIRASSKSAVRDGRLNVGYGNDEFKVYEIVEAADSGYQQQAQLDPGSVASRGTGSTLRPVSGLEENLKLRTNGNADTMKADDGAATAQEDTSTLQGIRYSIGVQAPRIDKQGSIDACVMGQTEAQWATEVNFNPENYFFGMRAIGIGFAPIDELGMTGQATEFPVQILPPGNVEIQYRDKTAPDTPEPWEKYLEVVEEKSREFDNTYGGSTPALWYYLENVFKNEVPVNIQYTTGYLKPLERYQLSMVFKVDK
ncbi:MAG: hypothetical protein QW781_00880 [Methanothrix sp.]